MRRIRARVFAPVLALISACASSARLARTGPAAPEPFVTIKSASLLYSYDRSIAPKGAVKLRRTDVYLARYALSLGARRGSPPGTYLEIMFEHPTEKKPPLVLGRAIEPGKKLRLQSPDLEGFECVRSYEVTVAVYSDSTKSTKLETHRRLVESTQPLVRPIAEGGKSVAKCRLASVARR